MTGTAPLLPPADLTNRIARTAGGLTVRLRLLLAFGLLTLGVALVGGIAMERLGALNDKAAAIRDNWLPSTAVNGQMISAIKSHRLAEARLLFAPDADLDRNLEALDQRNQDVEIARRDYQQYIVMSTEDEQYLHAFDQAWAAAQQYQMRLRDLLREKNRDGAIALYNGPLRDADAQATDAILRDLAFNVNQGRATAREGNGIYQATRVLLWSAIGLAVAAGAALALLAIRTIAAPIRAMTQATGAFAQGRYDHPLPCTDRRDEIAGLAAALAVLRDKSAERDRLIAARTDEAQSLSAAKTEAETNLATLRQLQDQLVESEKLAALGALVAGVAHEVNSPLGVAVSASSTLALETKRFLAAIEAGQLRQSTVDRFARVARDSTDLLERNLDRATTLVQHFKQVAVDRASSQRRQFNLGEMVSDTLTTLGPMLRRASFRVETAIPDGIDLDSYPGPLGQVLTNLIQNAELHAFDAALPARERHATGQLLRIEASRNARDVTLRVQDNGAGMGEDVRRRLFEPFFTTKMGQGGSGLGMHIVYNIVTGILGGAITVLSTPGEGTTVTLTVPLIAPHAAEDLNTTPATRTGALGRPFPDAQSSTTGGPVDGEPG
ncbi:sensor histidine kinase [Nitrospirillum sp. BR 11163]|uniref:sensor histidine kinase n=1 Tax=Nitrospirillum sp. BR 11163 TaxID=3104323 RepID=UPI002AFF56DC|nr:ATP-binding protein [Nitrospirillum sp. BR 11163]MEA1673953.1 ATP-binding protein [Nitrospirillum sp. BR 11163]